MSEWISVKKQLPKNSQDKILICVYSESKGKIYRDTGTYNNDKFYDCCGEWIPDDCYYEVTHWMNFPNLPENDNV